MIYLRKGISMFNFNQFYRMFEDQYRGSTDLIKDRLSFYLPFILPLKEVYPQNFAVDLGCGRGEWVEMLADNGFFPTGVDINDEMVSAKKHEGIVFENRDALDFLKSLPGKSQSLITAFHLIEHISFSYLADLLVQVERVLLPGGLLILETPNPENFRVATESFYLDPSHLRPIPLQFISFLVDYIGIKRQK
jgi:SAM-dependent methyltransferase